MAGFLQRLTVNPNIAFGKPVIRGLRYAGVEALIRTHIAQVVALF